MKKWCPPANSKKADANGGLKVRVHKLDKCKRLSPNGIRGKSNGI